MITKKELKTLFEIAERFSEIKNCNDCLFVNYCDCECPFINLMEFFDEKGNIKK